MLKGLQVSLMLLFEAQKSVAFAALKKLFIVRTNRQMLFVHMLDVAFGKSLFGFLMRKYLSAHIISRILFVHMVDELILELWTNIYSAF